MKELVERFRTIVYLTMCILFTVLIFLYIDGFIMKSQKSFLLGCAIVVAMILVDYVARRYVTNALLFFGIHLLFIAAGALLPAGIAEKILLAVIAASYLYLSVGFWRTELAERSMYVINIPGSLVFFFVLVYLHASLSKAIPGSVAVYAYIAGIVYVILFYIREYLDKFLAYSLTNGNFSKELEGTFMTNISLIGLFGVISVFGIAVINLFFSDSSFNVVGKFLRNIVKAIVAWIRPAETGGVGQTIPEPETSAEMMSKVEQVTKETTQMVKDAPKGAIDRTLETFIILLFVAILIAIVVGIYKFIKSYMHKMGRPDDVVEKITYGDEKVKEKKKVEEKRSIFASNDKKVRKIYKDYVKSNIKKNSSLHITDSNTPEEIKEKMADSVDKHNIQTLTEVYRKARYSGQEITKEDVASAKNASKY